MMNQLGCCCANGGNGCPAPCLQVSFSGIQALIGDTSSLCFNQGGPVVLGVAGINGVHIVPFTTQFGYHAEIPVSISVIQSDGGLNTFTTVVGGLMSINVGIGACAGGLVDGFTNVAVVIAVEEFDNNGSPLGAGFAGVFQSNQSGFVAMGGSVGNSNAIEPFTGCVVGNGDFPIGYGGTATVSQPPQCVLPATFWFAQKCGSTQQILVDPSTLPPSGAASCIYNAERYIPLDPPVTSGTPVGVLWSNLICPSSPGNILARECGNPANAISIDPTTLSASDVTVLVGTTRFAITTEVSTDPSIAVVGSPDPCPGQWFRADICGTTPDGFPIGTVIYQLASGMNPGDGMVAFSFVHSTGASGVDCLWHVTMRPTTVSVQAGSSTFVGVQTLGQCNSIVARTGDCSNDAGGPGPVGQLVYQKNQTGKGVAKASSLAASVIRRVSGGGRLDTLRKKGMVSEAELDAMGASPEAEAKRIRQGGCCGPPSPLN